MNNQFLHLNATIMCYFSVCADDSKLTYFAEGMT